MTKTLVLTFSILLFFSIYAFAIQEFEAVVTDKKFNSSSAIVIDEKEIKKSRAKDLTTLLATQANISITQSNFQPNSLYLRGGDSSHVLILVDGVPFYDSSSIQRTVNLNLLNLKSIQRIEVLKGSQSVLFGGQALSGVIKITTIPKEFKTGGLVNLQIGTQSSRMAAVEGVYGINEQQALILRASLSDRKNESPVKSSSQLYPSRKNSLEAGWAVKGSGFESLIKAQTAFDKTFIATSDPVTFGAADADNFEFSTYQSAVAANYKLTSGAKPTLIVAHQKGVRLFEQETNDANFTKEDYIGELLLARIEATPYENEETAVSAGLSANDEKIDLIFYNPTRGTSSEGSTKYYGAFVKIATKLNSDVTFELGGRVDLPQRIKPISTYHLGATFFESIKAEYSTGFKQASLYQMYSNFGNLDLEPERSTSASLSFEQNLTPNLFFSITAFQNQFTNLITTVGTFPTLKYQNVSKTLTTGAELSTGYRFDEQLNITLNLGYQEPRDIDRSTWLVKRALRTASFKLRKEFEKAQIGFDVVHNGDKWDRKSSTSFGFVEGYTILNATAEYQLEDDMSVYVRGQNLTNNIYETSHGFYDEGQSYNVGVEATF